MAGERAQEIIDGIESSKQGKYEWANEDVQITSSEYGVLFFNLMTRRARISGNGPDFELDHDGLLEFMRKFKEFIEENQ